MDRDWHSSISFDSDNILRGLQFQTSSQAEEIHIRVTATAETIREKSREQNTFSNNIGGGGTVNVGVAGKAASNGGTAEDNGPTPKYNANPIKLIITTSGALGHRNQHYNDIVANPDTAYGGDGGVGYVISDEDNVDAYDDLGDNLDLASLLAHHEANLDMDDNDDDREDSRGITTNHSTTLKSEQEAEEEEVESEPVLAEIMSDTTEGGVEGEVVMGVGTVAQFHNDEVEKQREATTFKVSVCVLC